MRRLLAALACLACACAHADTLTVFAASSLKEALDAAVKPYEARTAQRVVVSYAGSNVLARQIEAGAPADLFVSADLEWMDYLQTRNLIRNETRANVAGNRLVLIAPAVSRVRLKIARGAPLARALGGGRLAIGEPDTVPGAGQGVVDPWVGKPGATGVTGDGEGPIGCARPGGAPPPRPLACDVCADASTHAAAASAAEIRVAVKRFIFVWFALAPCDDKA